MKKSPFYLQLGRRVCKLRYARNWSQDEMAWELRWPRTLISGIETGRRILRAHELVALCDLFAVTADQLVGRTE